jgi:PAS domain S-box-containing protein
VTNERSIPSDSGAPTFVENDGTSLPTSNDGSNADAVSFKAVFEAAPEPYLLLSPPDFRIVGVNEAYLQATLTTRDELVGRLLFDAFPDNPDDTSATGVANLSTSLQRVLATAAPDAMAIQKYDIRRPVSDGGGFEERYWQPLNTPVLGPDGAVRYIIHHVEDVTNVVLLEEQRARQQRELAESEARFERLAENAPDIIYRYRLRPTPAYEYVSLAASTILGYTPEEFYADPGLGEKIVHPDDRELLDQVRTSSQPQTFMLRWIRKDGTVVWTEPHIAYLYDDAGDVVAYEGIVRDVTDRKQALDDLEARARQKRAAADLGARALLQAPLHEVLQDAARTVAAMLGSDFSAVFELRADENVLVLRAGRGWAGDALRVATLSAAPGTYAAENLSAHEPVHLLAADSPGTLDGLLREHGIVSGVSVAIRSGGRTFGILGAYWSHDHATTTSEATFMTLVSNILAGTIERTRSERELRRSMTLLRQTDEERQRLLGRLLAAQEDERRRISADIHDDSVQVLAALAIRLEMLRRDFDDPVLGEQWDDIVRTTRLTITRLRHLMFQLAPVALERDGLLAALDEYLKQTRETFGLAYELHGDVHSEPPLDTRVTLYRIAQEAIVNVTKHAAAARVDVCLDQSPHGVMVTISDDGRGFDAGRAGHSPGHLGLVSMRERAEAIGGWCRIESRRDGGTTVRACVPIAESSSTGQEAPQSLLAS